jgi:hypothetical protein
MAQLLKYKLKYLPSWPHGSAVGCATGRNIQALGPIVKVSGIA